MTLEEIEGIEEEIDRLNSEKKQKKPNFLDGVPKTAKLIFAAGITGILYYGTQNKWDYEKMGVFCVMLSIGLYAIYSKSYMTHKRLLTSEECRIKLLNYINRQRLRPIGDISFIPPNAKIKIDAPEKLKKKNGRPEYRTLKLMVLDNLSNSHKIYKILMDPFEGEVVQIIHSPEGMRGDEDLDEREIIPPEIRAERKIDRYLKINNRGN